MARKIVAGNWKMNLHLKEGQALVQATNEYLNQNPVKHVDVLIAPPAYQLSQSVFNSGNNKLSIAAQNMSAHDNGAYTGELSASMLLDAGAELVIIGHSERRTLFGEDDALINAKVHQALRNGIYPILCIGESLEQRKNNEHEAHIKRQLDEGLKGLAGDELYRVIIAYEPIWAIGTGETATPVQAQNMHSFIRRYLSEMYSATVADEVSILYGGSVKPSNARDLFGQPDIDGALIGGASIVKDSFLDIIQVGEEILR